MDANQNPPSERDWTEQEKDEFYASIGLSGTPINKEPFHPIEWSTSTWNGPIHPLSSDDPFGDLERFTHPGIHVTSLTPPESGWPIACYCPLCKETVFVLSPWAIKPEDGDYWKMNHTCLDEDLHIKHNMYPQKWYPWPQGPIEFQVHDPLPPQDLPSMIEFTQEMPIEEAKKRWPNTPVTERGNDEQD